jgi:phospholipid transport system transporter-binding protein
MSEASVEQLGGGRVRINGDLNFETVPRLLSSASGLFTHDETRLVVDLGGVRQTMSVGLALLVAWLRHARRADKNIAFINVPPQLLAMARASGLETILALDRA